MALSSGFVTVGSYLAFAVDSPGVMNSPARVGRDQGVEVDHRLTALFEEAMITAPPNVRRPNHLAGVVYAPCIAMASESAQVLHLWGSNTPIVEEGTPAIVCTGLVCIS